FFLQQALCLQGAARLGSASALYRQGQGKAQWLVRLGLGVQVAPYGHGVLPGLIQADTTTPAVFAPEGFEQPLRPGEGAPVYITNAGPDPPTQMPADTVDADVQQGAGVGRFLARLT